MSLIMRLQGITLTFPHKSCFENLEVCLYETSCIGLIGPNGSGKTSLLRILEGTLPPTEGKIQKTKDLKVHYVPQVLFSEKTQSGGERLMSSIQRALQKEPNILLLDEPTNHLDFQQRQHLIKALQAYRGALIVASHDMDFLPLIVSSFWSLKDEKVHIFQGSYEVYCRTQESKHGALVSELASLKKEKRNLHKSLMKEQERAKKSNLKGEKSIRERKWPTLVSDEKGRRALITTGRKKGALNQKKERVEVQLQEFTVPEIIVPKFSIASKDINEGRDVITIADGGLFYDKNKPILQGLYFNLGPKERIGLMGPNGSGKSTFVKALLNEFKGIRKGKWLLPKHSDIGYLDQHYETLLPQISVFETIALLRPLWSRQEIRRHLNAFLFAKNEEVMGLASTLSGGEKARLCLAQISALTPKILILDEVTNNLDLRAQKHVEEVLKQYPGALLVISHSERFLNSIDIECIYEIKETTLIKR